MAIASGVAKQVRYKVESAFGTAPGASGAQLLRRVESSLNLTKDTYESEEIRTDYQVSDFRHGVRRVAGAVNGELSPKTYSDFIAAALRKDFVTGQSNGSLTITITGSANPFTVAATGIGTGIKIGDVVRLSGGSLNAANVANNLLVTASSANSLTVRTLNASNLVAQSSIASCTCAVTGKKTYVPSSSHTDKSFSIEHWFSDIAQSELFTGCKFNGMSVDLPATGISRIGFDVIGQNVTTNTSAYYTSPTAATTQGVVAAVNGVLMIGSSVIATCTGANVKLDAGMSQEAVVGSNTVPAIFAGRVRVSGQFSAYFEDATLRDAFLNETETKLIMALTCSNDAASDFITFVLPRIKLGGSEKDDGEKGIVQTLPFTALYNASGTDTDVTTIAVQDSAA